MRSVQVRRGAYVDSVTLMQVSRRVGALDGVASALVATPKVLFMDEPTTGLDPASRLDLWDLLTDLVRGGTTLLPLDNARRDENAQ